MTEIRNRVIKSICKVASTKIINILAEENIDTIEDVAELTVEDLKEMGIAAIQAKKIVKMCEQFKLKIALDNRDNAVGFVRVPRAYKLSDVREQIIRDELPVPSQFVFTEDGTKVTHKQEEKWDVETYLLPENNGICVIRTVKEQTDIEEGRYSSDSTETEEETRAMLKDRQPCCNELSKTWGEENLTKTVDIIGDDLSERVTSLRSWAAVATAAPPPPAATEYTTAITSQTQVYIGNLVATINNKKTRFSDDELKLDYVYQFGQVKDYNRPVDHYAFVAFAYHESAEACIEELNNRVIGSFKLVCRYAAQHRSHPNDDQVHRPAPGKVLLTDLPDGVRPKDVLRCFRAIPVANVVIRSSQRLCLLMFESDENAEKAARRDIRIRNTTVNARLLNLTAVRANSQKSIEVRLREIIDPFLNGSTGLATVQLLLRETVQNSTDLHILCALIMKESIYQPDKSLSLCKTVTNIKFVSLPSPDITKMLQKAFIEETEGMLGNLAKQFAVYEHTRTRHTQIRTFLSYLVSLQQMDVVQSSQILECAERLLESAPFGTALYGRSITEALLPSAQKLKRDAPNRYEKLISQLLS
ncbi:uncharacterized protein [Oscarella lobularis]|uniref:uncharacterized protein isoform X2 n=1 Tax=Oscarella lobularis TaxID=121494 RepID=UPI003313FA74